MFDFWSSFSYNLKLNSKRRLRSCCKWKSKSTAGVKLFNVVTLPHISHQRMENHNPKLILIQKSFLVSILLKHRKKRHSGRTSNKIWQMTSLWLKLRVNWLHETRALNQKSWSFMLVELKQVKIPASRQLIIRHLYFKGILNDYFLKLGG